MACTFTITAEGSTAAFLDNAKTKTEQSGGTFEQEGNTGTFAVPLPLGQQISGGYVVNGQDTMLDIVHKPF